MRTDRLDEVRRVVGMDSADRLHIHHHDNVNLDDLVAVVCSRLGHRPGLHQRVGKFLSQSAMRCRSRGESLLVAVDSAIDPWARRASELFAVPIITLAINQPADIVIETNSKVSKDAAVIAVADRIDAAYVRKGGTIESSLITRLRHRSSCSIRVAFTGVANCAAKKLIDAGAVGWFVLDEMSTPQVNQPCQIADEPWTRSGGRWLIHCTRGPMANWPDETMRQYRDAILLGNDHAIARGPLDALVRILRSGRLVASCATTQKRFPVVCFSDRPLQELLSERCFRSHLGRWDYEPYGIAIRVDAAKDAGMRPVIYGDPSQRKSVAQSDQYRFHPVGRTFDWTKESEWRAPETVDLTQFDTRDVRVFAAIDPSEVADVLPPIPWRVTCGVSFMQA